jgi:hypothetical protein
MYAFLVIAIAVVYRAIDVIVTRIDLSQAIAGMTRVVDRADVAIIAGRAIFGLNRQTLTTG